MTRRNPGVLHMQGENYSRITQENNLDIYRTEMHFTEQLRRKQKSRAGRARDFLLKVNLKVLNYLRVLFIFLGFRYIRRMKNEQ